MRNEVRPPAPAAQMSGPQAWLAQFVPAWLMPIVLIPLFPLFILPVLVGALLPMALLLVPILQVDPSAYQGEQAALWASAKYLLVLLIPAPYITLLRGSWMPDIWRRQWALAGATCALSTVFLALEMGYIGMDAYNRAQGQPWQANASVQSLKIGCDDEYRRHGRTCWNHAWLRLDGSQRLLPVDGKGLWSLRPGQRVRLNLSSSWMGTSLVDLQPLVEGEAHESRHR